MDTVAAYAKAVWQVLPTIMGVLAGFFTAVLSIVQLYESRTFQHWKNNWLMKHRARLLARLQRRAAMTAARIQALQRIRVGRQEAKDIVNEATAVAATITEKSVVEDMETLSGR